MKGLTAADVVAGLIVGAATVGILVVPPAHGFVGWDTYPILAAARIGSWQDVRGLVSESLTADYFPFGFYRPVFSASMALDYSVWGLDPFGFRLTNAVLFGATALALYRFMRALLGPDGRIGALVSLVTVLVFPLHHELAAGPFANRSDLLYALFVVLALHAELRRVDAPGRWQHLLPACATVLAQASKEAGIVVPALVVALVLLVDRGPAASRLGRALRAGAWHAAAVGLVIGVRTLVLGGVGGHASTSIVAAGERLPAVLGRVVSSLLAQRPAFAPGDLGDVVAASGFALACAGAAVLRARGRARDEPFARALEGALLGAAIVLACAGVFALVGWVAGWYLFLPSIGLAMICGAAVESAGGAIRAARGRSAMAWALCATGLCWVGWLARASPLVAPDRTWAEWTATNDAFLSDLESRIAASPPGGMITIAYPGRILQPYSVQAWADLVVGSGKVRVVRQGQDAPAGSATTVVLVGETRRRG
jgi:hypothetical protein